MSFSETPRLSSGETPERLDGVVIDAVESLSRLVMTYERASIEVPSEPGLYAFSAAPVIWEELRLGEPPDDRPLYVGKSESSLAGRDIKTHFATGKTGSSTLRRSVAALLADDLELEGVPRNRSKPGHFANFSLQPDGDARLTRWMTANLHIAIWPTVDLEHSLDDVETAVLRVLQPPLNLAKVSTPWKRQVSSARRRLAAQARTWAATGDDEH